MSAKWPCFTRRAVASGCLFGGALYAGRLHRSMFDFTSLHYQELDQMKFDLFRIQDGLEILYRGLLVFALICLLLAFNAVVDWRRYVRLT